MEGQEEKKDAPEAKRVHTYPLIRVSLFKQLLNFVRTHLPTARFAMRRLTQTVQSDVCSHACVISFCLLLFYFQVILLCPIILNSISVGLFESFYSNLPVR